MIKATISGIESNEGVNLFKFSSNGLNLTMLGLENLGDLKIGDNVNLSFKSSNVIIASKPLQNCSLSNEIRAILRAFEKNKITSILHLKASDFEFESIISTNSFERLNLKIDDEIYAYIKATSLFISDF